MATEQEPVPEPELEPVPVPDPSRSGVRTSETAPALSGPALAKAALTQARVAAAAKALEFERGEAARRRATTRAAKAPARRVARSGDGEPTAFGDAIAELLADRGWTTEVSVATVTANWAETVGADIAAHCRPLTLREGVLTVEAESTAWATQIRLLAGSLMKRIAEVAGDGTVTRLLVRGPTGPNWKHGRLSAPGRGPRDTYG